MKLNRKSLPHGCQQPKGEHPTHFRLLSRSVLRCVVGTMCLFILGSCATQKNTATTRWWKSFKTRYNTYFNGHQAYLEGMKTKTDGNKDNYSEVLPLMMVSNKNSKSLGSSNFETTITKCEKAIKLYSIKKKPELKRGKKMTPQEKAYRNRMEFNPFIKNAWILMGKAQMEKGDFIEAASTFAYTARLYKDQPQVLNIARSLWALCYTELDWFYDAEELLRSVKRDSVPRAARRPYNTAMTNYLLRQKRWEEALPYLRNEVKNLPHGIPRARGYYLLGQLCKELNNKKEAYRAFQHCMNQSPPYEMKFNAQILQTEVMPQGSNQKKIAKLKRMLKKPNNKNYLDRIYYAIGNIYLAEPDTNKAIENYELGGRTEKGSSAKGVLMLKLGDIYWERERFGDSNRCYTAALSSMDKENERYEELKKRNNILSKLALFTNEIHFQDSVQALVRMPEADRNAVIDKVIAYVKQKQKEERRLKADSLANERKKQAKTNNNNQMTTPNTPTNNMNTAGGTWYFYNQQTISQGVQQFQQTWGTRKNEDNWRRSDKSATAMPKADKIDYEKQDSTSTESEVAEKKTKTKKTKNKKDNDSIDNGPLTRAYYLAQLPFSEEKLKESNKKLSDALFQAGIIEKDLLDNYSLSSKTLLRLYQEFPNFEPMDELLYHLFLMELHWGSRSQANAYKNILATRFPKSKFTKLITAPDYEENAKYGVHLEDSLYAQTYEAYKANDYTTIARNCKISAEKYPKGANRAKFLFFDAMNQLRKDDIRGFTRQMREITTNYKEDEISELAKGILQGIQEGKVPAIGNFTVSDLWQSRNEISATPIDSTLQADTLQADKYTDYTIMLIYSPDSVKEGQLLYDISRFNFTNFNVRNFNIEIEVKGGKNRMIIQGFNNFDEVHRYQQELYQDSVCRQMLKQVNSVLISDHNLKLIGVKYSLEDYLEFYQKNFVPNKVKEDLKIDQSDEFIWDEFQEVTPKDEEKQEEQDVEDDGGEWY